MKKFQHKSTDDMRDKLDKDNAEEARGVRREIARIKRAYIRRYGTPKSSSVPFIKDVDSISDRDA